MMEKLISVIVPCKDVEPYLEECINSIRVQTHHNLEILLTDDGSVDGTGVLCDKLAALDERIKVCHQSGAGLSEARNVWLDKARGDYIAFVDSDDVVSPDLMEKLLITAVEAGTDLAMCGFDRFVVQPGGERVNYEPDWIRTGRLNQKMILDRETFFDGLLQAEYRILFPVVWNKLYKRELFEGLRFKKGSACEDEYLLPQIIHRAGKVAFIPDRLYHYRIRSGSISGARGVSFLEDHLNALMERVLFLKENGYPNYKEHAAWYIKNAIYECTKISTMNDRNRLYHLAARNIHRVGSICGGRSLQSELFMRFPDLYMRIRHPARDNVEKKGVKW